MTDAVPSAITPRRGALALWLLAAALLVLGLTWCGLAVYHDFHYRVRRLRLGMTRDEVVAVMGRPDCMARLGRAQVLFYIDPAWHTPAECAEVAPSYSAPSELPGMYSSIQIVLDHRGTVSAFVHVGESGADARGPQKPEGVLNRLPLEALE